MNSKKAIARYIVQTSNILLSQMGFNNYQVHAFMNAIPSYLIALLRYISRPFQFDETHFSHKGKLN